MAQRISRAKRTVSDVRLTSSWDLRTVLKVLYLVFNECYSGDVDHAAEAISPRGDGNTTSLAAPPSDDATQTPPRER